MREDRARFRRSLLGIAAFAAVYLALSMLVTNSYYQLTLTLVPVWAVMGLSWNMLSGYTGLVSFGHASFFGLGAYTVAIGFARFGLTPWLGIPLATLVGAVAGLVIGLPTLRLRGHYFALAMLAYPLALLYVFEWAGFQEVPLPMRREAPAAYMQFDDHRIYIAIATLALAGVMVLSRWVETSRFGRSLLAIKQNEPAAEAAGIDTLRWKLKAIALSGAIAGGIGGFYAVVLLIVTPASVFGMLTSAQALIMALFGGIAIFWGPVIGAVILIPLSEYLHAELGQTVPGIQGVIFGAAIIAVILLAPEGIYWKVLDLVGARKKRAADALPVADAAPPDSAKVVALPRRAAEAGGPILSVRGLSKSFGGLKAVQDVSFDVPRGAIIGIIGPNGAGKTTLFNLLNNFLPPSAGEVTFEGRSIVGLKPNAVCRLGIGRTFQVVRPFARMSVVDNVVVGAYVATPDDDEAKNLAVSAVERVGLGYAAGRLAGELTNRELRLMEIARALAGQPKLLLLDETLAGLGAGEVDEVLAVISRLSQEGLTLVIIEHTMHAMVRLVDRFVVLDHGAVLTEGLPQEVTREPKVIEAYLGKKWANRA